MLYTRWAMQTPVDPAPQLLSPDTRVVLLGFCVAALTSAGNFFQKLNGVRGGNAYVSVWLLLATACFFPTYVIANKVFLMGGKLSLFVPATATAYVFSIIVGRLYFGEPVAWDKWFGCLLILAGVGTIVRS
jgi:drug/metabolite transporter (DMT)-like permease